MLGFLFQRSATATLTRENARLRADLEQRDAALEQIVAVCRAAAQGNLEPRVLHVCQDDSVSGEMARCINQFLDLTDAYVRESAAALTAANEGRFYRRFIERGMRGTFQAGARIINGSADEMKAKTDALEDINALLHRMAEGDFTGRLDGLSGGVYGRLQDNLNGMTASLASVFEQVRGATRSITTSSAELTDVSRSLSDAADGTSRQIENVASSSQQAGQNVQTVAVAAEELSASIQEINGQLHEAYRVSDEAKRATCTTVQLMETLGENSKEIGDVVTLIAEIAKQTNLLALNATIEAARAGEQGRGFAVVAKEVGELAGRTASATDRVSAQVLAVQGNVEAATSGLNEVTKVVERLGEINSCVSVAMEEQTAVTSDIARNVTEAAQGTDEAARGVEGVVQAVQATASGASQSLAAGERLAGIAVSLDQMVDRFKTS